MISKKNITVILAVAFLSVFSLTVVRADYALAPGPFSVENLGSPMQSVDQEGQFMFELPGGEKHALLFFHSGNSYGKDVSQLLDLNIANGSIALVETAKGRTNSYPVLAANNKFYMFTSDANPSPLVEYDPISKTAKIAASMTTDKCAGSSEIGDDGKLYFGGCVKGTAVKLDPDTGQLTEFGRVDASNPSTYFISYTIGSDGRYIYVGLRDSDSKTNGGGDHYYLGVIDQQTGSKEIFFKESSDTAGEVRKGLDNKWYYRRYTLGAGTKWYVFTGGTPTQVPSAPQLPPSYKKAGIITGLIHAPAEYGFEFDLEKIYPSNFNNQVTVRWRKTGEAEWKSATQENIRIYPIVVKRLVENEIGEEQNLIGATDSYGPIFYYDPTSKQSFLMGRLMSLSLYDILFKGDDIYFSGYPAITMRCDPSKAWNLSSITPNKWSLDVNPRQVAGFGKYHYYTAVGSDELVYVGIGHLRDSVVGGSLGWYDPQTDAKQYIHVGDEDGVADLKVALSGTKIVFSSTRNRLFVFDAATKKIEREIVTPMAEANIVEIEPGIVLGVPQAVNSAFTMFKADIRTGEIISTNDFSGVPFNITYDRDRRLILGPDKRIWLFIGNSLYRINPADYSMEKIIDTTASNIMFHENNLYFYGTTELKRISNILVQTSPPEISLKASDINSDTFINATDLDILKTDFLRLTASLANPRSDINADGQCTVRDLGILMSGWK